MAGTTSRTGGGVAEATGPEGAEVLLAGVAPAGAPADTVGDGAGGDDGSRCGAAGRLADSNAHAPSVTTNVVTRTSAARGCLVNDACG